MRSILNSSLGRGRRHALKVFDVFAAVALAGIFLYRDLPNIVFVVALLVTLPVNRHRKPRPSLQFHVAVFPDELDKLLEGQRPGFTSPSGVLPSDHKTIVDRILFGVPLFVAAMAVFSMLRRFPAAMRYTAAESDLSLFGLAILSF